MDPRSNQHQLFVLFALKLCFAAIKMHGDGDTANLPQTLICYPVDRRTSYIIGHLRAFVKRKLSPAVHRAAHRRENLVHLHGLEPGTH